MKLIKSSSIIATLSFVLWPLISWAGKNEIFDYEWIEKAPPSSMPPGLYKLSKHSSFSSLPDSPDKALEVLSKHLSKSVDTLHHQDTIAIVMNFYDMGEVELGLSTVQGTLRSITEQDPMFLTLRVYEALGYFKKGDFPNTKQIYESILEALEASQDQAELQELACQTLLHVGSEALRQQKYTDAKEFFHMLKPATPTFGRYSDQAIFHCANTMRYLASSLPNKQERAAIYALSLATYEHAIEDLKSAIEALQSSAYTTEEETSVEHHLLARSHGGRGAIYMLNGDWENAINSYLEALKTEALDPWRTARTHHNLGMAYYHLSDFDKAAQNFEQTFNNPVWSEESKRISRSLWAYSKAYSKTGDKKQNIETALATLDELSQIEGSNVDLLFHCYLFKGCILTEDRRYREAIGAYRIPIDKNWVKGTSLSRLLKRIGDTYVLQAEEFLSKITTKDIKGKTLDASTQELVRAFYSEESLKPYQKSLESFTEALKHVGDHPDLRKKLKQSIEAVYLQMERLVPEETRHKLAVQRYSKTLQNAHLTTPKRLETLMHLAHALISQKKMEEAMGHLREYITLQNSDQKQRQYALKLLVSCYAHRLENGHMTFYINAANAKYQKFLNHGASTLEEDVTRLEAGESLDQWFLEG